MKKTLLTLSMLLSLSTLSAHPLAQDDMPHRTAQAITSEQARAEQNATIHFGGSCGGDEPSRTLTSWKEAYDLKAKSHGEDYATAFADKYASLIDEHTLTIEEVMLLQSHGFLVDIDSTDDVFGLMLEENHLEDLIGTYGNEAMSEVQALWHKLRFSKGQVG